MHGGINLHAFFVWQIRKFINKRIHALVVEYFNYRGFHLKLGVTFIEIQLGKGAVFALPPLHITIIAVIVIFLLVRWSKQLETRRFTIFFYFLISTYIAPIYSRSTLDGEFQLWVPFGFIIVFIYLFRSEKYHPSKMKASVLGLCIALYQLILQYIG